MMNSSPAVLQRFARGPETGFEEIASSASFCVWPVFDRRSSKPTC